MAKKFLTAIEVDGTIKVKNYTLPSDDGTDTQVLKTNGAGTVTWQDESVGGVTSVVGETGVVTTGQIEAQVSHDNLQNIPINDHLDWTINQGYNVNIHSGNYDSGGGGGATITDDTTTDATYYPTFATATSGDFTVAKVSSSKLTFNPSTGTLSATDLNSLSDKRLKYNIKGINTSIIDNLEPVEFLWKDTNIKAFGLIAQDVKEILPEIVNENDKGILSISYLQLIPFLIKEIQDLKQEVNNLKSL